jgi:predicted acyl esterase
MGPRDQSDAKTVIEWAAKQAWSNGRVGAIGHSYPGGTAVMSLGERPKGLVTAVVSAGLGSMYEHQFQGGVPYYLQWAGPYTGYPPLTIERQLPVGLPGVGSGNGGDDLGNDTEYLGCGFTHTPAVEGVTDLTALDQLSGRYSPWHAARDFRTAAAKNPVPVFAIHGINDHAARVASLDWFLRRKRTTDKLWLGQWDHGLNCCPNRRGYQWTQALHAWFDKQLQLRDVSTGPPVEIFLSDASEEEAIAGARTEVFTAKSFPVAARPVTLFTDAAGGLRAAKATATNGTIVFTGDPFGLNGNEFTGGALFTTPALDRDIFIAGMPKLRLAASVTVPRVYLIASLFDQSPSGDLRRIGQFAINPELRAGISTVKTVVPGQKYVMYPPGFVMAHHLRKGHRLTMRVTTSDPDKAPFFTVDPNVTVYTGAGNTQLQVPVVDKATFYKDDVRR